MTKVSVIKRLLLTYPTEILLESAFVMEFLDHGASFISVWSRLTTIE